MLYMLVLVKYNLMERALAFFVSDMYTFDTHC